MQWLRRPWRGVWTWLAGGSADVLWWSGTTSSSGSALRMGTCASTGSRRASSRTQMRPARCTASTGSAARPPRSGASPGSSPSGSWSCTAAAAATPWPWRPTSRRSSRWRSTACSRRRPRPTSRPTASGTCGSSAPRAQRPSARRRASRTGPLPHRRSSSTRPARGWMPRPWSSSPASSTCCTSPATPTRCPGTSLRCGPRMRLCRWRSSTCSRTPPTPSARSACACIARSRAEDDGGRALRRRRGGSCGESERSAMEREREGE
mmetsp:Transcript_76366/g.227586  ORF Transcript_76366/g.227586 Transcript_76366/m.227586 type:complete len:264 (+) Transcript_76366:276-1067(+)